jgi:hypothetical protein
MVLPGCGKSNSSSSGSAGQTTAITSPKGTVSGTVEDNNGNPIAGASVYVAGQTPVTTNAGGQFSVGVTVTGATTSASETSASGPNAPLTIQIVPPAGYLGASITVSPSAQITTSDAGSTATGETNPQEVFIDGFSASAGIVMIPATTTTVRGQILNSDTGNAVPTGTTVDLDFIAPQFDQTQHTGIAFSYASGGLLSATTDVNGNFSITNVPDDSCIRMDAPGFTLSNASTPQPACTATTVADPNAIFFATIVESAHSVVFSRIGAVPAVTGDTVPPYVTSVSGVINEAVTPGVLDSATTNTIVVSFSKPVTYTPTAVFQPIVIVGNPPTQTAATITSATLSGQALTIVLASPLKAGTAVTVDLPIEAIAAADSSTLLLFAPGTAVNTLSTTCAHPVLPPVTVACGEVPPAVGFDAPVSLAGVGTVDQLTLKTTATVTTTAPAPTIAQVTTQNSTHLTDAGYLTTSSLVSTTDTTVAATAVTKSGGTYTTPAGNNEDVQLNSQLGNTLVPTVAPPSDAATYLSALASVINGGLKYEFTNIARVTVTIPVGATDVVLSDQVAGVAKDVLFFPINTGQGLPSEVPATGANPLGAPGATGQYEYVFVPPAGVTLPYSFDVSIAGDGGSGIYFGGSTTAGVVLPGDTIVAQTRASAGLLGGSASLVLKDFVPPTTTVQLLTKEIAAGAGASAGAGGGVITTTGSNTGITILPVSPQSGDVVYTTSTALNLDTFADDTLNVGLGDTASGITAATATAYTNLAANAVRCQNLPTSATGNCVLADATSTATYLGGEATKVPLAIDIDEEVTLTGTATPAYSGTNATLSNYVAGGALNQATIKGTPTSKINLVGFTASNLVALQADARTNTAIIDLTGAIQDMATVPNVATAAANAKVELRDVFPPLVTRAFYDGTNLVVDFDEPVTLTGNIQFTDGTVGTCHNQTISLAFVNPTGVPPITLVTGPNGAKTEVVIPVTNALAQPGNTTLNIGDCLGGNPGSPFATGYAETAYTAANLGTATGLAATQIVAKPTHGGIDYSTVPDTANNTDIGLPKGNTWANWSGDNLGLNNAQFLAANILGPFALADAPNPNIPSCSGLTPGATSFSCTIVLTQPLLIAGSATVTTDVTGATLPMPNAQGNLTQTQINTFLCGDGVTPGTGKFALVVPQNTGNPFLRARCSSAILENGAGVQVFNNTGTQIILSWSGLTTTGSAALPNLIGEEPVAGDVVELAVPGAAFQNNSTSVFVNGLPFTMSPDLESAYTLPTSASLTLGMTPASNGIIANTDNQATPVPAFELIGFVVP